MIVRPLNIPVGAIQWLGDLSIGMVRRIPPSKVDLSATRGIIVDRRERFVLDTDYGTLDLSIGDWIILIHGMPRFPCKPDLFEQLFEEII